MSSSSSSRGHIGDNAAATSLSSTPQFPTGLRVLVVDRNPACLRIVQQMLLKCLYNVTTCTSGEDVLSMLREKSGEFDLVLTNVMMPGMDGFKLLEIIGLEMDLPVIMISAADDKATVMKGVTHGACNYLIKPVRIEALKTIWQHVVRKRRRKVGSSGSESDNVSSVNEGNGKNVKRRKEGKEDEEEREDSSTLKKVRVVWSIELHQKFVTAVNQLGIEKAVPKKVLELMKYPGLSRENVASHLQKYRLYLKRVSVPVPQHQRRYDTTLTGATEAAFGSINSGGSFDLQSQVVSNRSHPQTLVTTHPGARRVSSTGNGNLPVDQIGFFNSDPRFVNSSMIRTAHGQLLNNRQMNLLGPSTNTDSTRLGHSQLIQSYGNMGLQVGNGAPGFMNFSSQRSSSAFPGGTINGHLNNPFVRHMAQQDQHIYLSQQQNHVHIDAQQLLLNRLQGERKNIMSSPSGQKIVPNEVSGHVREICRTNTSLGAQYPNSYSYSAVPQAQYGEYHNSCMTEPARNIHPIVSDMRASCHTSGIFQDVVPTTGNVQALTNTTGIRGATDFIPNNLFNDWELRNINQSFESAQQHLESRHNNISFDSSNLAHQDFNATLKDGSRNTCTITKEIISMRTEIERRVDCTTQNNSTFLVERMKAGSTPNPKVREVLVSDNVIQDGIMSINSTQPQEGVLKGHAEFNFDGYHLDDITV